MVVWRGVAKRERDSEHWRTSRVRQAENKKKEEKRKKRCFLERGKIGRGTHRRRGEG